MAPASIASSGVISRVVTGSFERMCAVASASTVKRRRVEQNFDGFPALSELGPLAVLDDREHYALALIAGIAGEFGRAMFLREVEPDVVAGLGAGPFPRGAGLGLLLGHC